jgi:undecaprenyl pyrophosphate synthase
MIPRDIAILHKVPTHIAVILDERKAQREYDADETVKRATDFATWCACAGISIITIYERTGCSLSGFTDVGLLKKDIKKVQRAVQKSIATYMNAPLAAYKVYVHTPQTTLLTKDSTIEQRGTSPEIRLRIDMEILVIGQEDSRLPIVDLARTLGDMTKQEQLFPEDITIDLIHENLTGNSIDKN